LEKRVTSSGERILVIGGTRGTGFQIVQWLLRDGHSVRVLARNAARARETLDPAVEVVESDITKPESLPGVMEGVDHLIFTAGVTGGRVGEPWVRSVTYDGIRNTLAAAKGTGFRGRFLYMSTVGVTTPSPAAALLNLIKRNVLKWRKLAEEEIRSSGIDYTIIRAGMLTNDPAGRRAIEIGQSGYPLAFQYRISRADVAEVFVEALRHPETRRARFNVVGVSGSPREEWRLLLSALKKDA
jgi:uncharacterized protein YbjT (DUF2867 family)